jgi:hypothetical protein
MARPNLRDVRREWPTVIGRIIIAFGNIEHAAVSLNAACASDTYGKKAATIDLEPRLIVLDELVSRPGLP